MHLQLASSLGTGEVMACVAIISAWMVLMCLKTLALDIEYAIRWHNLKVEVHTLRNRQKQRMRDIAAKVKASRE